MNRYDDTVSLRQMLDHAREAVAFTEGCVRSDLDTNRLLNLALRSLMEIVGEAANRVSETTRSRYTNIPWLDIIDFRNRIIHGYDTLNLDIVWTILTIELPPLIVALEAIVEQREGNEPRP